MSHEEKCCDPALKRAALKTNNAKLPGNRNACVGANRFLVPSKRKKYQDGLKKNLGPEAKNALIQECSEFSTDPAYRNAGVDEKDPFAKTVPMLDGRGNLLGSFSASAVQINWGMIKRMPRYDIKRLRDREASFWKCDPAAQPIEYVFAFATRARLVWRTDWLPPDEQAAADKVSKTPDAVKAARLADADKRGYTNPVYVRTKDRSVPVSGWIPRSAIRGARDPKTAVYKLLECSKDCMSELRASRKSGFHGPTIPYTFVDLPQVKWAKSEFKKGKGLSDVASTARQKQFGPDWIASDLTGEGWKKFDSVGSGKLTTADIVERAYCERVLGKTKDSPGRKKQLTMDDTFHGACIFKGKKKVDTNAAVGDYLARNLTVPRELRIVYLLWAIPGGGGVAMDSFPLGATFHRYPNVKKQKNPTVRKTLIYVRKNGKMVATSQKLTWFYGFISYPMGDGKSGHAHGWVLKNVLARAPKPKK